MGYSNNKEGRPAGKSNKSTESLRNRVRILIEKNFDRLQKDLEQMTPAERIRAIKDLLQFVLPKLRETEETNKFSQLNENDLQRIIKELSQSNNQ